MASDCAGYRRQYKNLKTIRSVENKTKSFWLGTPKFGKVLKDKIIPNFKIFSIRVIQGNFLFFYACRIDKDDKSIFYYSVLYLFHKSCISI